MLRRAIDNPPTNTPYVLIVVPLLTLLHKLLRVQYPEQDYTLTVQRGYMGRPGTRWEVDIQFYDPASTSRLGGEHFTFDPERSDDRK
jgi:hypothetical protein